MKKTIIVHVDGVPAHSFEELGARTVWQTAQTPYFDDLAQHGELGCLGVSNDSRPFVAELALLSLLGYDPHKEYAGPGAFESMNLEVVLDRNDVAFLCDFVTLRAEDGWGDGKKLGPTLIMDDASGAGLETEDARELIDAINDQLVSESIQFYMGHQARHLMVWVGGNAKIGCGDPRQAKGKQIDAYLAKGEGSQILRELMEASRMILRHHSVNQERIAVGLKPVNCLWPWGQSKPVELTTLKERWSIHGSVVSRCGPYRGVALASGLQVVNIDNSDESQTDPLGMMASIASKILETQDLACLHVPVSRIASHQESATLAAMFVEYLEQIDEQLIRPLQQTCGETGDVRLFVVATPSASPLEADVSARYVLYEGLKMDGEPSGLDFGDEAVLAKPLQNATTFFERFARKP